MRSYLSIVLVALGTVYLYGTQAFAQSDLSISSGSLRVKAGSTSGALTLSSPEWNAFHADNMLPQLVVDGAALTPTVAVVHREGKSLRIQYIFADRAVVTMIIEPSALPGLRIQSALRNVSAKDAVLNHVILLQTDSACLGADPAAVRVLEQSNYSGRVVPLTEAPAKEKKQSTEPGGAPETPPRTSTFAWLAYDRNEKRAFFAGFESSERWVGTVQSRVNPNTVTLTAEFDGGNLMMKAGEEIRLETMLLATGQDPWHMLESYADAVRARFNPQFPATPPVSWCSWYPYRLGVTEDRAIETARIAAKRLKPLGLSVIELDLGWEKEQLPSTFEENEQFPHGLKWLSERLAEYGFDLGVWKAPYSISEFDPLAREHPEWLVAGEDGKPLPNGQWFWEPHGNVYILDLTHPGAQEWLRSKAASLHERGVKYLKSDFIGCVSGGAAKRRYDPRIVGGGGVEAARIGARIIREAMPDALLLNCGGPEMPGTGYWPLLYTCSDTGNSGFITAGFQRDNYQTVACHLFKNFRWGVLQPSCLCVGLPGTVEDARLRATIAFMAGGQVDIGDTLTTLPEDRWHILTSTLPTLGVAAKPVDLFEPVYRAPAHYDPNKAQSDEILAEHTPGSVWHTHVKTDWDEWDLVAVFSYDTVVPGQDPEMSRFVIPLERLGLAPGVKRWGYEFWSGMALGEVPSRRTNPRGYQHPGDYQDLMTGNDPSRLDIAFYGPGVKLLCLRTAREHPWVVGTSFHQSCGAELKRVAWDAQRSTLSGEVARPSGEQGYLVIDTGGKEPRLAEVNGKAVAMTASSKGAWLLPITVGEETCTWRVAL
ncbi:MAG: alpha-galactosidase [Candidatus Hydrogenedentes bacterium]|nr:alpha-galactosidase [Candidatus Hydrogenedentota bacterium]